MKLILKTSSPVSPASVAKLAFRIKPLFVLLYLILFTTRGFAADAALPSATVTPSGPMVTTLAGSGGIGFADGTGNQAWFADPYGLTADSLGNIYVADMGTHLIRKITSAGVVTSLAGSAGGIGSKDGTGAGASFNGPIGITSDASGNLYVADSINCLVRKITPAGVVTTLAGTGTEGKANGTGNAASFSDPYSVAVDASGNVYVADYGNNLIRKITPAGVVTTLAGSGATGASNGTGTEASFHGPTGVAVDPAGNIYVGDSGNHLIRKITPASVVTTLAGSAGTAGFRNGSDALFKDPSGVAVDTSGNLYVADAGNSLIRKISPRGVVTTLAGSGKAGKTDGIGKAASFNGPFGVTVDALGNVYVADTGNEVIRKITP